LLGQANVAKKKSSRRFSFLECAGRAQRRQRFCAACKLADLAESGVALRLPPQSKTYRFSSPEIIFPLKSAAC
jgi:hypothetical protein